MLSEATGCSRAGGCQGHQLLLLTWQYLVKVSKTRGLSSAQAEGFSSAMIDRFFRPFLGGIFFDTELRTTSRLFEFVMRCLATGQNCLPARGIGAVSAQLAAQLPAGCIHTGAHLPHIGHLVKIHPLWQPPGCLWSRLMTICMQASTYTVTSSCASALSAVTLQSMVSGKDPDNFFPSASMQF